MKSTFHLTFDFSIVCLSVCLFAFIYSSEEWNKLDEEARKKLGIDFEDDGEFWLVRMCCLVLYSFNNQQPIRTRQDSKCC